MSTASCNELLTKFQEESSTTRKLLARAPDDKFDFKPVPAIYGPSDEQQ